MQESDKNEIVVIASSTGGPDILKKIIPKLDRNLDVPVVIIQHMTEGFTKSMAASLDMISSITVKEAEDGEIVKPSCIYVAPGGRQIRIINDISGRVYFKLVSDESSILKPCADFFLESLVMTDFEKITVTVLTGMGKDTTEGLEKLSRYKKTYVIAQDCSTCVVGGMPKSIIDAGLADMVLTPDEIPDAIMKR